jgi:hypothetical protein
MESCPLSASASDVIRNCRNLESFQYMYPRVTRVSNAQMVYEALLSHKDMKELVIHSCRYRERHPEVSKYGSFEDFRALRKLDVDYNTLSVGNPLPPLCFQ